MTLKIISLNVNGIRAAARKGVFQWLSRQRADIICFQEVRATHGQIDQPLYHPNYLYTHYVPATRKGYSGVAILSRHPPDQIVEGLGWPCAEEEGRYVEMRFGNLSVASLYMPSGSSSELAQARKNDFLVRYQHYLSTLPADKRLIICGDWNIAHTKADIKNWRGNLKNSGFLPHERAWMDQLFNEMHFVDGFRELPQQPDQYTWWSNRGQAWANNVGWRIDYQVLSPVLKGSVAKTRIYRDSRFSDHAPLIMDYDLDW